MIDPVAARARLDVIGLSLYQATHCAIDDMHPLAVDIPNLKRVATMANSARNFSDYWAELVDFVFENEMTPEAAQTFRYTLQSRTAFDCIFCDAIPYLMDDQQDRPRHLPVLSDDDVTLLKFIMARCRYYDRFAALKQSPTPANSNRLTPV